MGEFVTHDEVGIRKDSPTRVLLIDDNPDDRGLAILALKREFVSIQTTETWDEETLATALAEPPFDLIITDYQLNWTTGLRLLPQLKSHFQDSPIIMFTGSGNEEIAVQALKSGVDDYVLKSVRRQPQLASSARALLERKSHRRLGEELETRLDRLLFRLNVGTYRRNLEGTLLSANAAFLAILGFESFQAARDGGFRDLVLASEDYGRIQAGIAKSRKLCAEEIRLTRADGSTVWICLSLMVSESVPGEVEGIFEDITARKSREKALRDAEEALRQSERLESIGRLAGGVAHDFNNHLTSINGYAELLLQKVGETSEIWPDIVEIKSAGARAAGVTQELLAFGRRQMLRNEAVDLNAVIGSLGNVIRRHCGDAIAYETKLEPSLRMIQADPMQMENVILNLAFNALEALHPGGRFLINTENVEVCQGWYSQVFASDFMGPRELVRPGPHVSLNVTDTGRGMDPETMGRIFDPFFTTKKTNKGNGLGLSTVYGIVRQSNGHVFVNSTPGKGSVFRILIPALSVDPAIRPAIICKDPEASASTQGQSNPAA